MIFFFFSNFFEQTFNFTKIKMNKHPDKPFHPHFSIYFERALLVGLQRKHVLAECGDIAGIW